MKGRGLHGALAIGTALALSACSTFSTEDPSTNADGKADNGTQPGSGLWGQWGQGAQHNGMVPVRGQELGRALANVVYDPFVKEEQAETATLTDGGAGGGGWTPDGGAPKDDAVDLPLVVHYQAPLVDGDDVFMMFKTGQWNACNPPGSNAPAPCGQSAWDLQVWNEKRFHWQDGKLVEKWAFASDWKPVPNGGVNFFDFTAGSSIGLFDGGLLGWEPVFHPAMTRRVLYVPGAGGAVFKLDRDSGRQLAQISPFGAIDPKTFITGPLTIDSAGNVYYNVIKLALDADRGKWDPWHKDVLGAWLVKIDHNDKIKVASFASLVPGAPAATDACIGMFLEPRDPLPFPPSPTAVPPSAPCGSQRPGINVAPAVAPDGTIYTVSRSHLDKKTGYLVAVNSDLSSKWVASFKNRLPGAGCGSAEMPAMGAPSGCREGTTAGVDPLTNQPVAGWVSDNSTASPVVAPDGAVLIGTDSWYNGRGHLFKFDAHGQFLASYDFGYDITPAIYRHDGTYSVITKDNHYPYAYCLNLDTNLCPPPPADYGISQLDANLKLEWRYKAKGTADSPDGFEWCINAPVIDKDGTVFVNSEDGNLYAIGQGGLLRGNLFLQQALAAAYTPVSMGSDGKIYTQNAGHLFVVGDK